MCFTFVRCRRLRVHAGASRRLGLPLSLLLRALLKGLIDWQLRFIPLRWKHHHHAVSTNSHQETETETETDTDTDTDTVTNRKGSGESHKRARNRDSQIIQATAHGIQWHR